MKSEKMEALRARICEVQERKEVAVGENDVIEVARLSDMLVLLEELVAEKEKIKQLNAEILQLHEENKKQSDSIDTSSDGKASTTFDNAYFDEKHPGYADDILSASVVTVSIAGPIGLNRTGVRQFFVDHLREFLPAVEVRWNKALTKLRIIILNSDEGDVRELTAVLDTLRSKGSQFTYNFATESIKQTVRSSMRHGTKIATATHTTAGDGTPSKLLNRAGGCVCNNVPCEASRGLQKCYRCKIAKY